MRALRFHGNKDVRVDEVPEPPLRPGWVKVKNAWAGICGSDLHEYLIGPKYVPSTPHALTGETAPSVVGHEFSGTVVELGEGVDDLKIGQKCAVFPVLTDGTCYWCQREVLGMCNKWGFLGYSGYGGGMADYVCVERRAIHVVPDEMELDVAALVEPLAVAWHAAKLAKMEPTDTALILGAGPIGIATTLCLQAFGIKSIVVSEPSQARSAQAKDAGATHLLNPIKDDVAAKCKELTEGRGVHAVFECAGIQATFEAAFEAVRGQGKVINIAIFEKEVTFDPNILNRKNLTYMGSNIYTRGEFQEVIDAIAQGRIKNSESMITARVPLQNAVKDGFEALIAQKDKHVKILIQPNA